MYAIVETGGKQYRVKPGDTVAVEKLAGEPGEILNLDRVLLIAGASDSETRVGSPGVAGAVVRAEVLAHFRGQKIIIFRYKSKVRYRRKTGHRQSLTRLRITDILVDGASSLRDTESYTDAAEPAPEPDVVLEAVAAEPVAAPIESTASAAPAAVAEPPLEVAPTTAAAARVSDAPLEVGPPTEAVAVTEAPPLHDAIEEAAPLVATETDAVEAESAAPAADDESLGKN